MSLSLLAPFARCMILLAEIATGNASTRNAHVARSLIRTFVFSCPARRDPSGLLMLPTLLVQSARRWMRLTLPATGRYHLPTESFTAV